MSRIFLAGASGVIGRELVPLLVGSDHVVAGTTRTPAKADVIRGLGAEPVIVDAYDREALIAAVAEFRPDVVINELTDLPDDSTRLEEFRTRNGRIRTEGNRNLIDAARAAGAARFIAQSIAWTMPPGPGADAVAELERSVLAVHGVVVRYGQLYGPGTFYPDRLPSEPRVRIDRAAERTAGLLDAPSGIVTVTD